MTYRVHECGISYWIIEYKKWWWFPWNWHVLETEPFESEQDAYKYLNKKLGYSQC